MDIHQSNCKVLGLTLPSRAGWFFQAVPECVYSNFLAVANFILIMCLRKNRS